MDFLVSLRKWTHLKRNCYADGLFSLLMNTIIYAIKTHQSERKPLITTKPKINCLGFSDGKSSAILLT